MISLGRADREYALLFDPVPELVWKINSRLRISLTFHTFWESWPPPQKPELEWNIPRGIPRHFGACASPSGIFVFKTLRTYFVARRIPPSH